MWIAGLALTAACGGGGFDKPITLSGRLVDPQTLERGRDLYNRYCATCHGFDGKAETSQARALDPRPRDFTAAHFKHKIEPGDALPTDDELARIIRNGVPGTGMPAWPNLDPKDLDAVIQYIKTFSPRWRDEPAPGKQGAFAPPSIDDGNRALRADVTDVSRGATNVLPAPNDTVSFRAAFDMPGCALAASCAPDLVRPGSATSTATASPLLAKP